MRESAQSAPPRQSAAAAPSKVGRNDLCPCGSGKKFKKCHGAALEDEEDEEASSISVSRASDYAVSRSPRSSNPSISAISSSVTFNAGMKRRVSGLTALSSKPRSNDQSRTRSARGESRRAATRSPLPRTSATPAGDRRCNPARSVAPRLRTRRE